MKKYFQEGLSFMRIQNRMFIVMAVLIATAFPAGAADYDSGVQGKVILQTNTMINGKPISYPVTDHPKVTVMNVEIAPGAQTGWHFHPVAVYAYVLSGRLTLEMEDGQIKECKEGDAIIEVVGLKHNGSNRGAVPVKLVVFYLGAANVPNVIKSEKP